jgi:alcohol dehydrogenase class IV
MKFNLLYPENIIFGENCINELPVLIPENSRVLLVSGKSAAASGLLEKIKTVLDGFSIIDASGIVTPEPPLECVDEIIGIGRRERVDAVVAVGGGSIIDSGKVAAALIPLDGDTADYFYGRRQIERRGLFFAALPTTAGTGAEITKNSVLTDSEAKIKKSIRSPYMVPDVAIIDPLLTLSMPPEITAASGLDAFTQALESFTSSDANSVTRSLAKSAVSKIFANLAGVYRDGSDLAGRAEVAEGSLLSAMAFSQSGLGAVHGLAHPVGSLLKVPHGVACSILLKPVMEWNASVCSGDYAKLAKACGIQGDGDAALTEELISAIGSLCREMLIPESFVAFGLNEDHFKFFVKNCRSRSMECNPRPMSDDDVVALLKSMV